MDKPRSRPNVRIFRGTLLPYLVSMLLLQVACRTPFVGQAPAASRNSAFAGAKLSAKAMRTASRKSAVAAQAKVRSWKSTPIIERFIHTLRQLDDMNGF